MGVKLVERMILINNGLEDPDDIEPALAADVVIWRVLAAALVFGSILFCSGLVVLGNL